MYYGFGQQYGYNLLYTVAKRHFTRSVSELELGDFQRAYQRWVASVQPTLPEPLVHGVEFVDDIAREEALLAPLLEPSILDDREHYRDPAHFKTAQPDRDRVAREAAHVREQLASFRDRDPGFWEVFDIYTNHVVFPDSHHTSGGTSSGALGVIYLVRPLDRDPDTLYELLVHEATHLMMFVDERRARHYRDDRALANPENFAVSAVYQKLRPLDKVLHSIVVATEVLLHREHVLGHASTPAIHPPTATLAPATLASCESILALQSRRQLLAPRGVQLVETCRDRIHALVAPTSTLAVAS